MLAAENRLPATHLFLERPRLKVRVEKTDSGALRVHLEKFWHAHQSLLPVESNDASRNSMELLDLWGVDWNPGAGPFDYCWGSSRNRKIRTVERVSADYQPMGALPSQIALRAFDVFGNGVETRVGIEII